MSLLSNVLRVGLLAGFTPIAVAQGGTPAKLLSAPPALLLRATSTTNVPSEAGGAFMSPSKCDEGGNLYIRKYAMDRPQMGPIVKVDSDGKRAALFDPSIFSELALDRADAFSPAPDGGLFQIAQSGVLKPRIYVLHFSSDGTASSTTRLEADLEIYTFAAFADGNFLVSGVQRDVQNKSDRGRNFTAVFAADGREVAQLKFSRRTTSMNSKSATPQSSIETPPEAAPTLDLADAEVGDDGNLYVMRSSAPVLVYVISSRGAIEKTLRISSPSKEATASGFHLSGNRLAVSFWNEKNQGQTVVVADAQNGRRIAEYSAAPDLGPSFACYSANENVFTFLKLADANALEVIRAEVQ